MLDMSTPGPNAGLRIESAASVIMRDQIMRHMEVFSRVLRRDRAAGQSTIAAYVDGLAGAVALTIAGGHGSQSDVTEATVKILREAIDRDLQHLGRQ